jgi:cytosine deaminase
MHETREMTRATAIRNVRTPEGAAVDVVVDNGQIASVLAAGSAARELPTLVEGTGQLLLPALVESHVHFDKTLWGLPWRPNSSGPTRNDRIANEQRLLKDFPVPIAQRAGPLIEHCIARGSLHFRSHVDVQLEWGLRHMEAMLALREKYRHVIDMQLVAFPQGGMLVRPGTLELMREAVQMGADVVGGIDPAAIDRDPMRHLEAVFGLAQRYGKAVDIHLHDPGDLGRWQIERICDMTHASGLAGRVTISHAYCLGSFNPSELVPIAERLADLRISIMTCAPPHTTVPPAAWLRSRGVNVCSGSDGIRDAWSPMGNGDMLERAMLIALRFAWSKDEDLATAFDIVSAGGARALGLDGYGVAPEHYANLVLVAAENLAAAVIERKPDRIVISRGRVVARGGRYIAT